MKRYWGLKLLLVRSRFLLLGQVEKFTLTDEPMILIPAAVALEAGRYGANLRRIFPVNEPKKDRQG
jgi:hypothetical protein